MKNQFINRIMTFIVWLYITYKFITYRIRSTFLWPTMFLYLLLLRHWRLIHQFSKNKHAYQYFLILVYIWDLSCATEIHILAYNKKYRYVLWFSQNIRMEMHFSVIPISLSLSLSLSLLSSSFWSWEMKISTDT